MAGDAAHAIGGNARDFPKRSVGLAANAVAVIDGVGQRSVTEGRDRLLGLNQRPVAAGMMREGELLAIQELTA